MRAHTSTTHTHTHTYCAHTHTCTTHTHITLLSLTCIEQPWTPPRAIRKPSDTPGGLAPLRPGSSRHSVLKVQGHERGFTPEMVLYSVLIHLQIRSLRQTLRQGSSRSPGPLRPSTTTVGGEKPILQTASWETPAYIWLQNHELCYTEGTEK